MTTPTEIAFFILHAVLRPEVIGGAAVVLAVGRETYPYWDRHGVGRLMMDVVLFGLLLLMVALVALELSTHP